MSAHLASAENRGRTIGLVTGGLLGGILLSRTVSGAIGELLGWQAIYLIASIWWRCSSSPYGAYCHANGDSQRLLSACSPVW